MGFPHSSYEENHPSAELVASSELERHEVLRSAFSLEDPTNPTRKARWRSRSSVVSAAVGIWGYLEGDFLNQPKWDLLGFIGIFVLGRFCRFFFVSD